MTAHDDEADQLSGHDAGVPLDLSDLVTSRLIGDLNTLYAASAQPPHLRAAMDQCIRERAAAQPHFASPQRPLVWWRRRTVVISGVALAAIIAGAAYAASPLVDRLLPSFVLRHSQNLSLSRGACGFTMEVTRAYADANNVILGFSLSGPSGHTYTWGSYPFDAAGAPHLTDARGHDLMMIRTLSGPVQGTTEGQVMQFDAGSIAGKTGPFHLRLAVPSIAMTEQVPGAKSSTPPCITYRQSSVPARFRAAKAPVRVLAVNGQFSFDLVVSPLRQVREAATRQIAIGGGEQVTLERIVVTPTGTRLYLRRTAEVGKEVGRPRLTTAAGTYEGVPVSIRTAKSTQPYFNNITNPPGVVEYFMTGPPLFNDHGAWTLVVPTRHGSVTFHVTVP